MTDLGREWESREGGRRGGGGGRAALTMVEVEVSPEEE